MTLSKIIILIFLCAFVKLCQTIEFQFSRFVPNTQTHIKVYYCWIYSEYSLWPHSASLHIGISWYYLNQAPYGLQHLKCDAAMDRLLSRHPGIHFLRYAWSKSGPPFLIHWPGKHWRACVLTDVLGYVTKLRVVMYSDTLNVWLYR